MHTRVSTLALGLFTSIGIWAQSPPPLPCLVDDQNMLEAYHGNDIQALEQIAADREALEEFTREFEANYTPGARNPYIISVVFHVIHNNGPENISDEQLIDAIRVLNNDFNKLNADWPSVRPEFLDIVADVGIEFRLARKDPQGNCTNGITRTVSQLTYAGDQDMKNLIQWPRNRYLNVWVAASANGAAGYTYRPGSVNNAPALDGIVLLHNYTGSIGTASPFTSRTLTHEVGHWINLAHTWGNSNNPALDGNCNEDDGVQDTPNTRGWTSCNLNGATCPNGQGVAELDNVENYMEYSYCSKMFTNGQATRMIAALNSTTSQRNQLWNSTTLALTGVEGPGVLCQASFSSSTQSVCSGAQVSFSDESFHNVVSRSWSFPGGTPASSTEEEPTVLYTEPGVYPVTLEVSDGTTSLTNSQTSYITVLSDPGTPVPIGEGFEEYTSLNAAPWTAVNPDGDNTFTITTAAAYSGNRSIQLLNNSSMAGRKDELVSSTYDMSDVDQIRITYRYAFARRNGNNDDRLRFYVSNNCGASWSLRQQLRGSTNLTTAGNVSGTFIPAGQDQWGFAEINNVSAAYHTPDFRFKFEFESDGGNTVYIDNININGSSVGLDELISGATSAVVVPNPAKGQAQLLFNTPVPGTISVELMDVLGRSLGVVHEGWAAKGPQRIDLPIAQLRSGLYFVRVSQGSDNRVVRFIVE